MNYAAIGRNIRHYRRLRSWTTYDLSQASGLSLRFIERLEDGALMKAHPFTLDKIADALVVRLDELLSLDDPPDPPPPLPDELAFAADVFGFLIAALVVSGFVVLTLGLARYVYSILPRQPARLEQLHIRVGSRQYSNTTSPNEVSSWF